MGDGRPRDDFLSGESNKGLRSTSNVSGTQFTSRNGHWDRGASQNGSGKNYVSKSRSVDRRSLTSNNVVSSDDLLSTAHTSLADTFSTTGIDDTNSTVDSADSVCEAEHPPF